MPRRSDMHVGLNVERCSPNSEIESRLQPCVTSCLTTKFGHAVPTVQSAPAARTALKRLGVRIASILRPRPVPNAKFVRSVAHNQRRHASNLDVNGDSYCLVGPAHDRVCRPGRVRAIAGFLPPPPVRPGSGCEPLRLFRRGHRFRKTPGFGISGGQCPDEQGFAIMSQLTRAFGQSDRFGPIAEPSHRDWWPASTPDCSAPRPGWDLISTPPGIGLTASRVPARLAKGHAQMKEGFGAVWIDLDGLAIISIASSNRPWVARAMPRLSSASA